ncbi:hypothetical protein ACFX2B_014708 [Malus domestica]
MQKVRSLELNLTVLEEYIKELNRRQGGILPEVGKELLRISLLLDESKTEIKDLLQWKEIVVLRCFFLTFTTHFVFMHIIFGTVSI